MPNILINGINVEFPHDPYQVQVKFMEKMICSIQNSENSVLESPTGRITTCLFVTKISSFKPFQALGKRLAYYAQHWGVFKNKKKRYKKTLHGGYAQVMSTENNS